MKMKKLLAIALSAAMAVTSVTVPTGPGDIVLAETVETVTTTTWMSANSGMESLQGDFDVTYTYHEQGGTFGNAAVVEIRDSTHYIDFRSDNFGAIGTYVDETWTSADFTNEQTTITWWPSEDKLAEYGQTDGWALLGIVRANDTGVEASAHVVREGNCFIVDIAERDAKDLELLVVWHYEVELELEDTATITLSAGENCELTNISFQNNATNTVDTSSGLVGYYSFDGTLTNAVSSSQGTAKLHGGAGATFNADVTGTENYNTGVSGQAYQFLGDTVDDSGDTGDDSDSSSTVRGEGLELDTLMPNNAWTVSFWANPEQLTDATSLLFAIKDEATGALNIADQWWNTCFPSVRFWRSQTSTADALQNWVNAPEGTNGNLNQWTYITLTNDENGIMTLYTNGQKVSTSYAWKPNAVAGDTILLGINWWDSSYKGLMDEVTIYNRALSAEDVSTLYTDKGIPDLSATAVNLSQETVNLIVDGTLELTATIEPFYATDTVKWTTSDSAVVTVEDGKLTAKSVGTATITATAGTVSSTCKVNVSAQSVAITGLSISSSKQILSAGDKVNISLAYEPADATNVSDVSYTSTDPNVLQVSSNGEVTAVGKGTASVYASIDSIMSNEVEFQVYEASAVTSGWWNGTHICSIDFPEDGQAVQFDVVCSDMGVDDTDTEVAFFLIEAKKDDTYIDLSSYNDAWGAGASDYNCSRTTADYSNLISAGDSITVTVNRIGNELEAIFYNNTKENEFQRIKATVGTDFVDGTLYFYPQYGTYYVNVVSHSLVRDESGFKAATCTETGTDVYKCSDDDYVYNKILAATGHTLTPTAAKAATCTESGNAAYWHCSVCDLYFDNAAGTGTGVSTSDSFGIAAKGHSYTANITWTAKAEDGYTATATLTCANDASHVVENLDATVTFETTEATYTTEGKTVYTAVVAYEGKTYTDTKTVTLPKLEDTEAPEVTVTLGTNSWKELLNTISFGLLFQDTQTVTVSAADAASGVATVSYYLASKQMTSDELAALDSTKWKAFEDFTGSAVISLNPSGKYIVYVQAADGAGNTAYVSSEGIVVDDTAPVITGVTAGTTYCEAKTVTVTDNLGLESVTVNGTAVTLDEAGKFTVSPATGVQTIVATDSVGNSTTVAVTVYDGHVYQEPEFTWTANADGSGYTATAAFSCQNCNEQQVVTATVAQTGNTATCTQAGTATYTATVVFGGKEYTETREAASAALGHDYVATSEDATCTQAGTVIYTCARCQDTYTETGVKLPHQLTKTEKVDPGCEESGMEAYWTCAECGGIFKDASGSDDAITTLEELKIPATGHNYDEVRFTWSADRKTATAVAVCANDSAHTTEVEVTMSHTTITVPDCTTAGSETYTATVICEGKEYSETKETIESAFGHDYKTTVTNPTCGKEGYTTYTCSRCGDTYTGNRKPATGEHTYQGVITKAATYQATGVKTYTCSECGDTYTETIARKKLAAPVVSSAANVSGGVTVTWKKVTGAEGYYVLRKTASGKWTKIATIQKASTQSYTDKKAANGTTYSYTVQAYAGTNTSTYDTTGKKTIYLSKVTLSKLKNKKGKKLAVTYKKNAKAKGYVVQYSTSKSFKNAKNVTIKSAKSLSTTLKKLKKKKTYYVRVRAYKKSGKTTYYSVWSNVQHKKITK